MPTARDFINLALKETRVLGVGQTALAEDMTDGFTLLTRMLSQWQKRRWLIPALIRLTTVGNGLESNRIGPGQFWNCPRPPSIKGGYIVQLNTGGNPVSLPLAIIPAYEDYIRITVKNLTTLPQGCFYDGMFPKGNIRIWPIPDATWQINLLVPTAIGFSTSVASGSFVAGSGYVDNVYIDVPFVSVTGQGEDATADVTVVGGIVTNVVIHDGGNIYAINDLLTIAAADLGGTGAGFAFTVNTVTGSIDSEFVMPEEYAEAIHYGLALRMSTMYGKPLSKAQIALGKAALNTIRNANVQVPTMMMPNQLSRGRAFNIYNADGA